jgi:predicted ribosomally synthesized peptide with nif11-like leader
MTTRAVLEFRKAVNGDPALQNEIRGLADQGTFDPVKYAKGHGFEFSTSELSQTMTDLEGKLSDFELDLLARQRRSVSGLPDLEVRGAEQIKGGAPSQKKPVAQYA